MNIPNHPQRSSGILKTGFSIWKSTFKQTLPFGIIFGLTNLIDHLLKFQNMNDYNQHHFYFPNNPGLLIFFVISMFILIIVHAGMVYRINQSVYNRPVTFWGAFLKGCRKFLPFLMTAFLYWIITLGGFILLIVPGIAFSVYLLFSTYLVMTEDKSIIQAIKSSYNLVSGHWWRIAWVFFLISLIYSAFYFMAFIFIMGIGFLFLLNLKMAFLPIFLPIAIIFIDLLSIILYPFYSACMLAMLYDLKLRKTDLQ